MKSDFYTKTILTVIALCLAVIACKEYVNPHVIANAQGGFGGVQFAWQGGPVFFDTRTGEVWEYIYQQPSGPYVGKRIGQISKLGGPMTK